MSGAESKANPVRVKGSVKWFNEQKGIGFIIGPCGRDHFVHYSQINEPGFKVLREGQLVSFLPVSTPKGLAAEFVSLEK